MKAFRKRNSQREFHQRFRSQSAMEYLMTYGWAILIIAVVLAALFELGVFNPMTFAPKASPGSCQVVRPEGAGTTDFISLSGECNGELPQYVASFNGNGYITALPDMPSGANPRTITAWFFKPYTVNPYNGIVGYGYGSSDMFTAFQSNGYGGTLCVDLWGTSDQCGHLLDPSSGWYFLSIEYNGTSLIGYLGFDGTLSTYNYGIMSANTVPVSDTYPFLIGTRPSTPDYFGEIANVQAYNTALSANDVKALYQEGIGGAPIKIQNLVGWWPLNGNANDYSGNGNNGVASGVTYTSNWYSGYSAP